MSEETISRLICMAAMLTLVLSIGGRRAVAQSETNGAIDGTVTDPQGLAVPNASVTIHNTGTNKDHETTTNDHGQFRVVELQPGAYTATVKTSGFGTSVRENVIVEVGRVTSLEIPLALTGAKQEVQVTAQAPLVSTSQPDFSANVNQTFINALPTNGRRWSNFALGTPGAVPDGNFGLVSFRGISGLLNNNTVDGGDNNQAFFSEERGRTRIGYVVSQASIQEFQVNTSNYSAEYGRSAGGVVNAVTKSGTNDLHGSVFYYIRDNKLGATNPFSVQSVLVNGTPTTVRIKPEDRRQQFGGTLGGPLKKDRAFFFFTYDQQKRNFPGVGTPGDPTFLNLSSADQATLTSRGVTAGQAAAGIAYLQGLTGVVPRKGDQYIFFPKLDWLINTKNTLTVGYNHLHWSSPAGIQTQGVVARGTHSFGDDFVRDDSLITRLTSTFSSNITNELRFQYGRDNEFEFTQKPGPGEPLTAPNGTTPDVGIGSDNGIEIGKPTFLDRRAFPDEKRYQIANTISIAHNKHLVKMGADFNHVHDLQDNLFSESGSFSYDTLVDFLTDFSIPAGTGCGGPCYSSYLQGFGPTAFKFTTNDLGLFVQDDWRLHPRVTLNAGLRYEYERLPRPQIPNPLFPQTSVFPNPKDNFGPRVGFAWDVNGNGKTSLRGGYGIYFGRIINSTIANAITNTGSPQGQFTAFFLPFFTGAPIYPNTLTGAKAGKPSIVYFSPTLHNPRIHQVDLVFEHEIGWNTVLSVSYLGSLGQRLPDFIDHNLNPPASTVTYTVAGGALNGQTYTLPLLTGSRPITAAVRQTQIDSLVESHYSALVLQAKRRLSNVLQFQSHYTWSHATDSGQSSQTFTAPNNVFDPFNLGLEGGNSNLDVRHRSVTWVVWSPDVFKNGNSTARAIFNGFALAPILSLSSGPHFTPGVTGNAPGKTPGGGIIGAGGTNRFPFLGRNSFTFPSIQVVDLRISRRFRITEGSHMELLGEAFNLFNHENFTSVSTILYGIKRTSAKNPTGGCSFAPTGVAPGTNLLCFLPTFGTPNAAANTLLRERQIQLAVRFEF